MRLLTRWKRNHTEENRRYRDRHPDKVRARNAVTHAIRDKKLVPAKLRLCVDCQSQARRYDHYRGYDTENWLNVEPVCIPCCARRERARKGTA